MTIAAIVAAVLLAASLGPNLFLESVPRVYRGIDSWGSGFYVAPGLLRTAAHVVVGNDSPLLVGWPSQGQMSAKVECLDEGSDTALLRTVEFGKIMKEKQDSPPVSTPVKIVGHPGMIGYVEYDAVLREYLREVETAGHLNGTVKNTVGNILLVRFGLPFPMSGISGGPLMLGDAAIAVLFAGSPYEIVAMSIGSSACQTEVSR